MNTDSTQNRPLKNQVAKPKKAVALLNKEVSELLHELRLRQVELETQNEELRVMQHKLEEVRDQYTNLFDLAPIGYFILDKAGLILNVNLTGSGLLNSVRTRVKGKPFTAFLANRKESNIFYKHLRDVYKTETLHTCELLLNRKGEIPFQAQLETIAEVDEQTGVTQYRTAVHDLTGEKKTEKLLKLNEELEIEREKAQQYLHYSGVFFMTLDTSGKITMINQVGCKTLEQSCKNTHPNSTFHENGVCQLEGLNWFDNFIPKKEREAAKLEFKNFIKLEKQNNVRSLRIIVTKNGNERIIEWNSVVIKDKDGTITGILKSGEDVTEKMKAETALKESEKMFRTLFENATESIVISNSKGKIININPITTKLFGYQQKELIGQSIGILVPKNLKTQQLELHNNVAKNKNITSLGEEMNLFAINKAGLEFPITLSLSTIVLENESLVMALITDITERKQAKQKLENQNLYLEQKVIERTSELRESQQMYKLIASNFPNGVISVFDKNLNYVFIEGVEMFDKGVTNDMLIGTNFLKRINPVIRKELKENLMNVFKGHNMNFESKIEDRIYLINAVGLQDDNGNISQILMVTQNITNIKKAEFQIKQTLQKELQLNELKTQFVSIASHEFRTPLTTIMNSASLLSKYIGKNGSEEKQHEHICRVKKSVHLLTNILNDFLSLDKLDGGKVELQLSEFNISNFFQEMVDSLEFITKKGQQITLNFSGEENIIADKQALTNIYNNLLTNAIKYSGENSIIEFKVNVEDEILTTSIKDEGIGILKADKNKIFERFYRTKAALNSQGTGLGLNIVKKYVEIANGIIDFESRHKKGTTFYVKLPVKITTHKLDESFKS